MLCQRIREKRQHERAGTPLKMMKAERAIIQRGRELEGSFYFYFTCLSTEGLSISIFTGLEVFWREFSNLLYDMLQ